jgi:hypothetical protein
VTGILDMRPGKHDLHFLVGVELLPHVFVNIPDEKMHIGVYFMFIFILHFIFIYVYITKYIYIFIFILHNFSFDRYTQSHIWTHLKSTFSLINIHNLHMSKVNFSFDKHTQNHI